MELKKLKHYAQRAYELGFSKTIKIMHNRIVDKRFDLYWRKKAAQKKAHHTWADVTANLGIVSHFQSWQKKSAQRSLFSEQELLWNVSSETVLKNADEFVELTFDLLGSGKITFKQIPWHVDFRLFHENNEADVVFDPHLFYKDFAIQAGLTEQLVKDIKVPWELSRLQHFFVLGYAYQISHDSRYLRAFEEQFLDWFEKNPFLLGSHWVCPMDVGIRAVNLVWAYHFFKDAVSQDFLQKYVCVLYDHLFYLEHNWEVYDYKTSNHYLSDLIGYYYLCYFFYDQDIIQEKAAWCYQELLQEFQKQVFDEGTDYEGSTAYHSLVTEIFFHGEYLSKKMGFFLPDGFERKLDSMFGFIKDCTFNDSQRIQIGDNDSGKILFYGLSQELITERSKKIHQATSKHYKEFGLSILKRDKWHSTLRHHVYNQRQPSGHFHADVGSITLAHQGIPIFVDPGSYLYTPSAIWRNRFRVSDSHSTWYVQNQELIPVDERLFLLAIPEQQFCGQWQKEMVSGVLYTSHHLFVKSGVRAHRRVEIESQDSIVITDWFDSKKEQQELLCWNFILDAELTPINVGQSIQLFWQQHCLFEVFSTLDLTIEDTFVSYGYGRKQMSKKLRATKKCNTQETIKTVVSVIKE